MKIFNTMLIITKMMYKTNEKEAKGLDNIPRI